MDTARLSKQLFVSLLLLSVCLLSAADARAEDWKLEVLRLKSGAVFRGLVVDEGPNEVRFQCVRANPRSPTIAIYSTFPPADIAGIERLGKADREFLAARIRALEPLGPDECSRMENRSLSPVPWLRNDQGGAVSYNSMYFTLISNAREEIVRRAAVRLEEIYVAYSRYLPPRHYPAKPTKIYLVRSMPEYQVLIRADGRDILNPAFYDSEMKQIFCASELQRLGDELEKVRTKHREALEKLKTQEVDLKKEYAGGLPASIREQIDETKDRIDQADRKNNKVFEGITHQLFQTLYHEAFHAYLDDCVYPDSEGDVPRWLNEGLAQVFETAVVEAGGIKVGQFHEKRLLLLKNMAQRGELLHVTDLLKAGPQQFLVFHARDQSTSEKHYLNSWALAHYLTFNRKLLGTSAMDKYVLSLKRGGNVLDAFQVLVNQPLAFFERDFQQYLVNLRADGNVAMGK